MDEGRLLAVGRSRNYRRKCTQVMNDIIKNQQTAYSDYLTRESHVAQCRLGEHVVRVKHAVVRGRLLRQCLRALRARSPGPPGDTLGAYMGRPVASLRGEVEHRVRDNHPRERRRRRCRELMEEGRKFGTLLDPLAMRSKVDDFFQKNGRLLGLEVLKQGNLPDTHTSLPDDTLTTTHTDALTSRGGFKYRGQGRRTVKINAPLITESVTKPNLEDVSDKPQHDKMEEQGTASHPHLKKNHLPPLKDKHRRTQDPPRPSSPPRALVLPPISPDKGTVSTD